MFDPKNPDINLINKALHQAFGSGDRVVDIWQKAWCLQDISLNELDSIIVYMKSKQLVEESGEPDYYRITQKGEKRDHSDPD